MKIVVDAFGGDNAPEEIIKGVAEALKANKEVEVLVVGDVNDNKTRLLAYGADLTRVELVEGENQDRYDDAPTTLVRRYPNASINVAMQILKEREDLAGVVSSGNTGMVLTAAILKLGRMRGIIRPVHTAAISTINNGAFTGSQVILADCGANVDSKPEAMLQYALLANEYAKFLLNIANPRIALLNVGPEEHKGDEKAKEVYSLLKARAENEKDINFVGNMEARDFLSGKYDIVVSDGFSGNILLKSTEGAMMSILKIVKNVINKNALTLVGGALLKKGLVEVKSKADHNNYGGAYYLGCNKLVCKCHGSAKASSVKIAILDTYKFAKGGLTERLSKLAEGFVGSAKE